MNEKTQRVVDFTYRKVQFAGVSIGVIEIPIQERPTYLNKPFGKLGSRAVYVRNGSSTREATPDEIAKMGAEQALGGTPQIALHWADLEKRATLPSPYAAQSTLLDPASLLEQPLEWIHNRSSLSTQYTREVIEYTRDRATFTSLGFLVHNSSSVVGKRIGFEGSLDKSTGVSVRQWADLLPPKRHRRSSNSSISLSSAPPWNEPEPTPRYPLQYDGGPDPQVLELRDRWDVIINFGDIRPQETVWTNVPLWFGSEKDTTAALDGQLRGDNLSKPVTCSLEIQFQVGSKMMMREDTFPHIEP